MNYNEKKRREAEERGMRNYVRADKIKIRAAYDGNYLAVANNGFGKYYIADDDINKSELRIRVGKKFPGSFVLIGTVDEIISNRDTSAKLEEFLYDG
ncbi:hypothetical protein HYV50_05160 [Candidatus Pacearchaeota archaeon]|nr:hypothetical protein [Candidatus Pacearchaeota archaeon]